MKLREKTLNCKCVFAGFEPVSICGKHAKELYEHLASEMAYASRWKSIADGLYDVAMCEVSDKLCRCVDHVAAYELQLKEEQQ